MCELVTDSRYAYGKAGKYVVFGCLFVFLLCNSDIKLYLFFIWMKYMLRNTYINTILDITEL